MDRALSERAQAQHSSDQHVARASVEGLRGGRDRLSRRLPLPLRANPREAPGEGKNWPLRCALLIRPRDFPIFCPEIFLGRCASAGQGAGNGYTIDLADTDFLGRLVVAALEDRMSEDDFADIV